MSETPIEPDPQPGADEGQGDDFDPVQTGEEPATGPEAPVPPGGEDFADQPGS
ncbi:hypothetical protein [Aeromicrobium chenweiae]|uniref:hypothetical protein n=1 Tax=Aeromicrobium chenweiae TaxID=2079793 RepID=UPI00131F116C|nr:hypothetical protein [Aeromicrobium chenweiae]